MFPKEWILAGPFLHEEYDAELIKKYLFLLTPENLRIHIISKAFDKQTDKVEPYYKIQYSEEPFTETQLKVIIHCKWSNHSLSLTPLFTTFASNNVQIALQTTKGYSFHSKRSNNLFHY
jgi:hypothetical protein